MSYWISSTSGKDTGNVYHTDPECPRVRHTMREVPEDVLDTMDKRLCAYCDEDQSHQPETQTTKHQDALRQTESE